MRTNSINKTAAFLVAVLLLQVWAAPGKNIFTRRSYWIGGRPTVASNNAFFTEIANRAAKAGYNQVFHNDPGLQLAAAKDNPSLTTQYIDGYKRWKAECEQLGIQFLPFALGQLDATLYDVNSAEAIPVRGTPFVVAGTQALVKESPETKIVNGDFETVKASNADILDIWRFAGATPGVHVMVDKTQKRPGSSGSQCMQWKNPPKDILFFQRGIGVKPNRAYAVTAWIKTQNLTRAKDLALKVYGLTGSRKPLLANRYSQGISRTQNWTRHTFDFNALGHTTVEVQFRFSHPKTCEGAVWFDDMEIKEVGLFEVVRRLSLPVVVKSETGEVYKEGTDYTIQANSQTIADQQATLSIPAGSKIQNGQTILVDWYQYADMMSTSPAASFCGQEVWDITRQQAAQVMQGFGKPFGWMTKHSEWRLANWDPSCAATFGFKSAPEYVGGVARKCTELLREVTGNPNIENYVLNDNYDPYHNCSPGTYFMINGSPYGAWNFLDPQSIIMNWAVYDRDKSIAFFGGLDAQHKINVPLRQILSVNEGIAEPWLKALESAEAKGLPADAVPGINFGTWTNNWGGLEGMAQTCKDAGRWGTGLPTQLAPFSAIKGYTGEKIATNRLGKGVIFANNMLQYRLAHNSEVKTGIRDLLGRKVWTRSNTKMNAGTHQIDLDRSELAKGVYVVDLEIRTAGGMVSRLVKRVVVM